MFFKVHTYHIQAVIILTKYELQLLFFNSEFNEKQQVNQLSEHVAVKKFFILFLCKLEFLQLYFETTDNIYPLYVSKF